VSRQIRNDMSPRVTQRSWTEAPYKGDPGTTSVSVKKISDHALEETDKRDGKVISVARLTASPDEKAMKIAIDDKCMEHSPSLRQRNIELPCWTRMQRRFSLLLPLPCYSRARDHVQD